MEEQEPNKATKFQKFLYWFLIPLLFTATVGLVAMTVLGFNVFEMSKQIGQKVPFVSSLFDEGTDKKMEEIEKKVIDLEADIKDREARITQLEKQLTGKDQEMERAQLEKDRLKAEIEELRAIRDENKRAFKDIVKTYETISAKKAAPIIAEMNENEAVKILANVKPATLAAIMENMEPQKAAKMTALLTAAKESGAETQ